MQERNIGVKIDSFFYVSCILFIKVMATRSKVYPAPQEFDACKLRLNLKLG